MAITQGKKLMVFLKDSSGNYRSIAYATNHTLSTSASTVDTSHKDVADSASGAGRWQDQDIDEFSWNITSENFYAVEGDGHTFADLFNLYAAGTVLDVKFGLTATSTTGVPADGWTPLADAALLSGKCVITQLDLNAPVAEKASFTVTLTGKGPLAVDSEDSDTPEVG